jgi:hypothetical protein
VLVLAVVTVAPFVWLVALAPCLRAMLHYKLATPKVFPAPSTYTLANRLVLVSQDKL